VARGHGVADVGLATRVATAPAEAVPERGVDDLAPTIAGAPARGGAPGAPAPRPTLPATAPAPGPALGVTLSATPRVVAGSDLAPVVDEAFRVTRASSPVLFALRPATPASEPAAEVSADFSGPLEVTSAVIETELLPGGGLTGRETR